MKTIKTFLKKVLYITDEELLNAIAQTGTVRKIKKGEVLIAQGEKMPEVYFLKSGIVRSFSKDAQGKETTEAFYTRYGVVLMPAFSYDGKTIATVQVLSNAEFFAFSLEQVRLLVAEYRIQIYGIYNKLLQDCIKNQVESKSTLIHKNNNERYEWFINEYPTLIEIVNNTYIASFLGMSPVTLSRTRSAYRARENDL